MAKYFSAATVAFYDTDIIDSNNLPEDSVLLTDEEYADLMAQQCAGYVIVAGTDGRPVAMQQICEPCSCLEHDETIATAEKLGHIKIGSGLTIEEDGTVSAQGNLRTINNNLPDETGNITPKQTGCIPMTHITNCITEIPQDINLELSDGTLTLKAGSKVYVPNGFEEDGTTPKFDVVEIESDLISYADTARQAMGLYTPSMGIESPIPMAYCYSGNTAPTVFFASKWAFWYDTANNLMKKTVDAGANWEVGCSLPIYIVTETETAYTSIDQIFNGFGYIGSTIFALPGVKTLMPNGRNDDGTLNSLEATSTGVLTYTYPNTLTDHSVLQILPTTINQFRYKNVRYGSGYPNFTPSSNVLYFAETLNKWFYYNTAWNEIKVTVQGSLYVENGAIKSFETIVPFRAIDYSDKAEVAGWGMPSDRYIDLTLGETGASYTAPTNGWFYFRGSITNTSGGYIAIYRNHAPYIGMKGIAETTDGITNAFLPVKKGDVVITTYKNLNTSHENTFFQFIYAEGAK